MDDILRFCHIETERDENGSWTGTERTWRTFGDLKQHLEQILAEAEEIEHIRWKGIPDKRTEDEVLPYCDHVAVDVQRHWHDGIPKLRLYGLRYEEESDCHHAEYLYGIVYDPSSGTTDWEDAFQLAAKLRGAVCPDGEEYRHPNFEPA